MPPSHPSTAADLLTRHVAHALGVGPARVDPERPLTALGIEPWSAVRLRSSLRRAGVDVTLRGLLGGGTVRSLAEAVAREGLTPNGTAPYAGGPGPGLTGDRPPPAPAESAPGPAAHGTPHSWSTTLTAGLRDRLAARAASRGLTPGDVLLAAAALATLRWAGGGGRLGVRVERPGAPVVSLRIPAPDLTGWYGFGAYAEEVARVAAGAWSAPATDRLVLLAPSDGPGAGALGGTVLVHTLREPENTLRATDPPKTGSMLLSGWESERPAPDDGPHPAAGLLAGLGTAHGRLLALLADDDEAWSRVDLGWDPTFRFQEPLTVRPFPDAGPLLDGPLRAAAHGGPGRPALLDASDALTHGELDARAAGVAARLGAAGVGPGTPVAVAVGKGFDQIAAVAGAARRGAVYIPVTPSWPASRIAAVFHRAGLRHALVAAGEDTALPPGTVRIPVKTAEGHAPGTPPAGTPVAADTPAYAIFTSGSTGEPKGVLVDHAAARVTVDDITDRLGIGPSDRVLGLSALSFDLSVYDIFGVLGAGGALVLPDEAGERDPQHWMDLVERHGVTFWNTAPALMQMLLDLAEADPGRARRQLTSLRVVLLSGDWIPVTLPDRLRALVPGVRIVGAGGATEAAIWSICHPVEMVDPAWRSIPYGRPLRAQFFHILDEDGRPVPVGQAGELRIAGEGLARGYIGDPEQTAARFPVHPALGERLYRTGDMGRWRPDGTIEFLGRTDRQVKIRGHRIELGEIESVLDRAPGVTRAVATAVTSDGGRARLVAHVALTPEAARREPNAVRAELTAALEGAVPDYMVPRRIVLTNALPVTVNGKVDHARLTVPPAPGDPKPTGSPGSGR